MVEFRLTASYLLRHAMQYTSLASFIVYFYDYGIIQMTFESGNG